MIGMFLSGAGVFALGIILGAELNRRARSGRPVVGPFKRSKDVGDEKRRVHPGEYRL